MGLPVVPFIIGAAAGSLATYLYRDKDVRKQWLETVEGWYAGLGSLWGREKAAEQAVDLAEQAAETGAESADVAQEAARDTVAAEPQAPQKGPSSTSVH